jgi:hypothetical protein
MKFYRLLSLSAAILLSVFAAGAQNPQPQTPEQREKQMLESIGKEVERLTELLDLEDWQVFYVDSILVNDVFARNEELEKLQAAKVSNPDLYQGILDKWSDQIENSFRRFFTEDQWKKYSRSMAGEKKKREKRKKK